MKSLFALVLSLLLCSCADMVVTKTYVSSSTSRSRAEVDAKDFGSEKNVRYETNCGVGAANPAAIYIRPFCIGGAVFTGDEAASDAEMPIRKALTPVAFAEDLKEELSKLAPALVIWLVLIQRTGRRSPRRTKRSRRTPRRARKSAPSPPACRSAGTRAARAGRNSGTRTPARPRCARGGTAAGGGRGP